MDNAFAQVKHEALAPGESPVDDDRVVWLRRRHVHTWQVVAVERDHFGAVRMCRCSCGAARYDDRAIAV